MIIVNTQQGLANRLRAIESGLSLAYKLNTSMKVIWNVNDKMVASFTDLFIIPNEFILIPANSYKYARSTYSLSGIKKILSIFINYIYMIDVVFDTNTIYNNSFTNKINIAELSSKKVYLFSTFEIFFLFHYNYSWLKPVILIQQKVDEFLAEVDGRYCIGIHIRRTDNQFSIEHSTDIVFEKAIDAEILKNCAVIFFLATDDESTEEKFINKYGSKIIIRPKKFGRDSVAATQDAVVDLISLSKCQKLYCSFWSSFSETAAIISNVEIVICK